MADDERLLELLEQALAPDPAQPSPARVAAVRRLTEASTVAALPTTDGPTPGRRPDWPHRAGWLAAAASVAAAIVLVAMLASTSLVGSDSHRPPPAPPTATGAPAAITRLRVALLSGDVVAVARADAGLLHDAGSIAVPDRDDAVATHVAAIQFLHAHPSVDAAAALSPPTTVTAPVAPGPSTTVPPPPGPVPPKDAPAEPTAPNAMPVPGTAADGPPNVVISAVLARLDGTFEVDFAVTGFTADAGGMPGTRSVRFSFDDGQLPTTWDGPSPWSFPVADGVRYRQVCAHVADAAGLEDLSTGGCHDIV